MTKKLLCSLLSIVMLLTMLAVPAFAAEKPVTLEIVASQPEYLAQEQEIWAMYTEASPYVTIELISINEDTEAAFSTCVAGFAAKITIEQLMQICQDRFDMYYTFE